MIVHIDTTLPKITETQKQWAYKHCLPHMATRQKSGLITCLDCGGQWNSKFGEGWHDEILDDAVCPCCKTKVKVESTMKRNFHELSSMGIITTHQGFQVIRTFEVRGFYRKKNKKQNAIYECSRIYITPEGKYEIIGHSRRYSYYGNGWFGEFTLKHKNTINNHDQHPHKFYPRMKVMPILKRNGFKNDLLQLTPFRLFHTLLNNGRAETLLKVGHIGLFYYAVLNDRENDIEKYWSTIKMLIKNNYMVPEKQASDYMDYLRSLEHYGKDLKSPRYVCPKSIAREHDRYLERRRKDRIRKEVEETKKQIKVDQAKYRRARKKFFDLTFQDQEVTIKVIRTVKQVLEFGDTFRHCIYSGKYHRKANSLLLIATVDDKPVESIEFDLTRFNIIQSRGFQNKPSKYNKQIVSLVQRNAGQIEKLVKHKKTA